MEWVETTGKTLEEAKDTALDLLGVDDEDAEFQVVDEAKMGLFGRVRVEARVRARVRPTIPRPKEERRDRRRRASATARPARETDETGGVDRPPASEAEAEAPPPRAVRSPRPSRPAPERGSHRPTDDRERDEMIADALPLAEQGAQAGAFLEGLLEAFALDGQVELRELDEDTVEAVVTGDDLGLLIGPKGATLSAVQDLARTVVQRHSVARTGRLLVDISGYRQRRREALERFTKQVAEAVLQSGEPTALEPMTPADRKVVHDTATTIDGVRTTSEGEEPRRRVVVLPD
jgi:spoIIIJ-associated protein